MSNKIASVIVVFHRTDYIELCLVSLQAQTMKDFEIIVIDNSLNPKFSEGLKARYPAVGWFSQDRNLSYCESLNFGIAKSREEFILCLNDDIQLAPDYIEEAAKGFSRGPRIGMVTGKILRSDKTTLDSTGQFLSLFYTAKERGYGKKDSGCFDEPGYVFGVTGAAGFYRRQMLEEIREKEGYFDSRFCYFYEDLDVAWRAHRRKWSAYYAPKAQAYHVRGGSVRQGAGIGRSMARRYISDDRQFDLIKNRYLSIMKNASLFGFLLHLPLLICYELAVFVFLFIFRPVFLGRLPALIKNTIEK